MKRKLSYLIFLFFAFLIDVRATKAATSLVSIDYSSDISITLGGTTFDDENIISDNLSGGFSTLSIGAIPSNVDVIGFHRETNGSFLFSLDSAVILPGNVTADTGDVVGFDGNNFSIVFDSSAQGVPSGTLVDAVSRADNGDLILSFDTTIVFSSLTINPNDLVSIGANTAIAFSTSASGGPAGLNIDAAHRISAAGTFLVSFDGSGTVSSINFDDEDLLEVNPASNTWELAFDASANPSSWNPAADLDAVFALLPDADDDGTPDVSDGCDNDPNKTAPGACGCGVADTDTDDDGTPNCNEQCDNDPNKTVPGACGCGVADTDSDNDGTPNCNDQCPNDPAKTAPGTCGCGNPDVADLNGNGVLECAGEAGTKDQNGLCVPGDKDCFYETLENVACVGANGFLGQVNIASVLNRLAVPIIVTVQYFDLSGTLKDSVKTTINSGVKTDFIINDLGLAVDTVGNVCVTVNVLDRSGNEVAAPKGAWLGGIALYKPDFRNGVPNFGVAFDFALYYPFTNVFTGITTVPLNTFHLGVPVVATVANWISIGDAIRDGQPLTGRIRYYNDQGALVREQTVNVPDGGRFDYSGHDGLAGPENKDAVGQAEFVPDPAPGGGLQKYYLTLTRYFYDCIGASCNNFFTAFNLPNRPATTSVLTGGVSTINDEIAIIELNNTTSTDSSVAIDVYDTSGTSLGSQNETVAARGTRNIIINRVGNTGFLQNGNPGSASVRPTSGFINGVSLFYKLDAAGVLQYGYAAPLVGSPGQLLISQFNSFISQDNSPELYNSSNSTVTVTVDFIDFAGTNIFNTSLTLAPMATARLEKVTIPTSLYGTVNIQANGPGVVVRNYVIRNGVYTLSFAGE